MSGQTGQTTRFYKMGRSGIVALVVVIVLALAGAGLLAGALAGRDTTSNTQTGSGDFKVTKTDNALAQVAAAGWGAARNGAPARNLAGPRAGSAMSFGGGLGQLSPTPSASPLTPTAIPSVTTSETPTETPSPEPSGSPSIPGPTEGGISLDDGTVVIPLPEGWSQITGGFNYTLNFDGVEGYLYGEVDSGVDPATDAASLLPQVFEGFIVGDEHYSQLQSGDVESYQPFGGMVSRAGMWYEGQYGDTQGTYAFGGKIFLGIRSDGKAFLMTMEIYPGDDWDAGFGFTCGAVYVPAWASFAGEAWPYDPCAA